MVAQGSFCFVISMLAVYITIAVTYLSYQLPSLKLLISLMLNIHRTGWLAFVYVYSEVSQEIDILKEIYINELQIETNARLYCCIIY